jgi:hypothetical protein
LIPAFFLPVSQKSGSACIQIACTKVRSSFKTSGDNDEQAAHQQVQHFTAINPVINGVGGQFGTG